MKKQLNLKLIRNFMAENNLDVDGLCKVLQTTPKTLSKMILEGVDTNSAKIYAFAGIMNVSVFDLLK